MDCRSRMPRPSLSPSFRRDPFSSFTRCTALYVSDGFFFVSPISLAPPFRYFSNGQHHAPDWRCLRGSPHFYSYPLFCEMIHVSPLRLVVFLFHLALVHRDTSRGFNLQVSPASEGGWFHPAIFYSEQKPPPFPHRVLSGPSFRASFCPLSPGDFVSLSS